MLVDLLLSVGKDCSRLQNLKVGDVGGDVPGADVEMADVQDDGDVAAEGATPTSQPSAPVGDQPSTSPANQPDPPPLALHNIDDGIDLHTNPGYGALDGWIAELPSHEMVVQCKLCSKMRLMYKDQYVAFVKQHMIREVCCYISTTCVGKTCTQPPPTHREHHLLPTNKHHGVGCGAPVTGHALITHIVQHVSMCWIQVPSMTSISILPACAATLAITHHPRKPLHNHVTSWPIASFWQPITSVWQRMCPRVPPPMHLSFACCNVMRRNLLSRVLMHTVAYLPSGPTIKASLVSP